ncbi:biliverdin-producing heme oxygenase [Oxalobacteraceae bacterium A2-2]
MGIVDVLAALREATGERHARLDSSLPLADQAPTLADYRQHLLLLRAWLAPLARWQAGFHDGPQAAPGRDYLGLIDADLEDAAFAGLRGAAFPPDAQPWPAQAPAAYRWGVAYVLEGSQLGGAVLHKRLAARLAPHPLAYLRGAPEGPGPRWKQFLAGLTAAVTTPEQVEQACAGARDAFDHLLALRNQ